MSGRIFSKLLICFAVLLPSVKAFSEDGGAYGSFSPYSIFGLGNQEMPGTTYNRGMAGVGIASRNHRFINILNPAAVTARDTLSFMLDFSVAGNFKLFKEKAASGDKKSANNTFNIGGFTFSFPLWKDAAMMVGITPYTSMGYDYVSYETNYRTIATMGNVMSEFKGIGSIYQVFAGVGQSFFDRLSIGAQGIFYFGNIYKSGNISYGDESITSQGIIGDAALTGFTGKFGMQYEQPVGNKCKIGVGATYRLSSNMSGYLESTTSSTLSTYEVDTLANTPGRLKFADEIGVGISFNYDDKFRVEFDYTRSDWTRTNLTTDPFFSVLDSEMPFKATVSRAFRLGAEYVPNRNDIRYYFNKVAYRAGAYHVKDYFTVGGYGITYTGITLGATLPVFRWYNGVSLSLDFGKRGCPEKSLVNEYYFNFSVALNLFDIWFQKPKYE